MLATADFPPRSRTTYLLTSALTALRVPPVPPPAERDASHEVGPGCAGDASESLRRCAAPVRAVQLGRQTTQLEPPRSGRLDLRSALEEEIRQGLPNKAGVGATEWHVERCDIPSPVREADLPATHCGRAPCLRAAGAEARELVARTRMGPAFTCVQRDAVPKLAAADD